VHDPDDDLHKPCHGRWAASVSLGFGPDGKRIRRTVTGQTKTVVKDKLRDLHREIESGVKTRATYTVAECLDGWLTQARGNLPQRTGEADGYSAALFGERLGKSRLRDLSAQHVLAALNGMTGTYSTRTIQLAHNALTRAIRHAQAHDRVGRNVSELVDTPRGQIGRPSKSFTLEETRRIIEAARNFPPMHAYIVVSLLTGLRPEEIRAMRWTDVDLTEGVVYVLRAARASGDTKTRRSRRGLRLPRLAHEALRQHQFVQERMRREAGPLWREQGLIFASAVGTPRGARNVRRSFQAVLETVDGIDANERAPRDMRHTFVSLLSDNGVLIEEIARPLGHESGSMVTEKVYRHQLRPVAESGAVAMDSIFGS
jgi:integrase